MALSLALDLTTPAPPGSFVSSISTPADLKAELTDDEYVTFCEAARTKGFADKWFKLTPDEAASLAAPPGFQLLVVNFAGTTVTLDGCLVSDTIDAVAGAFATKLDLPKRIVRLMLEGTQLDAEGTLAHYQITAGCQLHALPRLPGGVATRGGGSKKRAADDGAAAGGAGSKRRAAGAPGPSGSTAEEAQREDALIPSDADDDSAEDAAAPAPAARKARQLTLTRAWAGRGSDDESPSDGRVAAAAEAAAEEPAAAAAEVDRLKAELCAATAEIERLKAENETLKAG